MSSTDALTTVGTTTAVFPRITIKFCTQCKWMLRAAYFAQELLSTFNTAIGEVSLQPGTGGIFIVSVEHTSGAPATDAPATVQTVTLWDRTVDGGFPETKELKRRLRDVIQPGRDLGHNDRVKKQDKEFPETKTRDPEKNVEMTECVSGDCN